MWLLCAATAGELAAWNPELAPDAEPFVSGVGIPATFAALLPKVLAGKYSLIVNIGIAGAYHGGGLEIGDIVVATGEVYADIGIELPHPPGFQPITASPFGAAYAAPFPTVAPPALLLPDTVRGLGATVNACTGTDATGAARFAQTNALFETMEGAAVAQVGQVCGISVCEIRAVSNFCTDRDMRPENIAVALAALREYFAACVRRKERDAT